MSEHQSVRSSNLASVAYDPEKAILEVRFHSGAVWQYAGVSAAVHEQLRNAGSPGAFFHAQVKSVYRGTRV